ncbi:MAG: hypothetical protein BGO24_08115 [Sphingomonas sp. 67-36]|nr:MAG: hypothetical protein BGO24_08115 [Sphingomonas sp. 67-36]
MRPKPVKPAADARMRISEVASREITPERISLKGETYWMAGANGAAIVAITPEGGEDPTEGSPAILIYRDGEDGRRDGLALVRTFTPDEADEFADNLKIWAARIRDAAGAKAAAALRKAAGR